MKIELNLNLGAKSTRTNMCEVELGHLDGLTVAGLEWCPEHRMGILFVADPTRKGDDESFNCFLKMVEHMVEQALASARRNSGN